MKRQGKPISALTAYDYSTARLVDEAGIDLILVGDSLAMVVLGHENTLAVTVDEMLHHTRAVRRAVRRALVVADMPFGSYHGTVAEAVANAVRFVKEAGAEAVKIEGPRVELVRALTEAEIPVVGHLGLTPQSVHRMGGYRVQARTAEAVLQLKADAMRSPMPEPAPSCLKAFPAKWPRHHRRAAHPHHRHRRRPRLRRPDSGLPRPGESHLRAAGQVCAPLRRCFRALPLRHRALPRRRGASRLPLGRGELSSA
jgi:3-methyl-2-oxobutanoate hydroxymethyltransferase